MPTVLDKTIVELFRLPARSRAELAKHLIASLDEEHDPDAEALWLKELAQRAAEIDSGKVKCRPAKDVFRAARKRLKG